MIEAAEDLKTSLTAKILIILYFYIECYFENPLTRKQQHFIHCKIEFNSCNLCFSNYIEKQ